MPLVDTGWGAALIDLDARHDVISVF